MQTNRQCCLLLGMKCTILDATTYPLNDLCLSQCVVCLYLSVCPCPSLCIQTVTFVWLHATLCAVSEIIDFLCDFFFLFFIFIFNILIKTDNSLSLSVSVCLCLSLSLSVSVSLCLSVSCLTLVRLFFSLL